MSHRENRQLRPIFDIVRGQVRDAHSMPWAEGAARVSQGDATTSLKARV